MLTTIDILNGIIIILGIYAMILYSSSSLTESYIRPYAQTLSESDTVLVTEDGNMMRNTKQFIPTGTIAMITNNNVPEGWLVCNGQTYDSNKYKALFEILGTSNVPDFRNFILAMKGSNTFNKPLLSSLGEESVKINNTHIPNHKHEILMSGARRNGGYHVIDIFGTTYQIRGVDNDSHRTCLIFPRGATQNHTKVGILKNLLFINNNKPHNNMQQCKTVLFIIKT